MGFETVADYVVEVERGAGMRQGKPTKTIFQPLGRRGEVGKGLTVIEASRQLGVDIETLCGEKRVCGKCKVRIEEGFFEKFGIESSKAHLSEWQEDEEKFIDGEERGGDTDWAVVPRLRVIFLCSCLKNRGPANR